MFVVAYMGYFSASLLFANVSHRSTDARRSTSRRRNTPAPPSAFYAVFIGWLALRPLFQTFGLTAIADLVGWLLIGVVIAGYGPLASALFRTGYASARVTMVLPLLAVVGTLAYRGSWPRSSRASAPPRPRSISTVTAFVIGIPAYLAITVLPIAARHARLVPDPRRAGPSRGCIAYAQAADGPDRVPAARRPRPRLTRKNPGWSGPGFRKRRYRLRRAV